MFNKRFFKKLEDSIRRVCKNEKKINLHEPLFFSEEKKNLISCINTTFVSTQGNYVEIFEKKISKLCGSKYVLATNSGTSALHIAYIVSGIKPEEEILIPSLNYIATSNVAKYIGAVPHFVEIEEESLGIDVKKLEKYLSQKTVRKGKYYYNKYSKRKISAIVPTHLYGNMSDIEGIKKISKKYNLILIEDAAESIGTYYKGKHSGTFGRMGIVSFNGNKTITTGSGGAIIFKKKSDFLKGKKLANIGKSEKIFKTTFDLLGYNYKINNLQAAVGIAQIKKINQILRLKKIVNAKYKKEFLKYDNVKLFKNISEKSYNNWINILFLKNIKKIEKIKLIKYLYKRKIKVRSAWDLMHSIVYFKNSPKMDLKVSKKVFNEILNLPSSPKYGL